MNKDNICIATISWARNKNEEEVLRASLEQLALLNIAAYITDGGSSDAFLKFIQSFPHFKLLQAKEAGVFAQVKKSLHEAYTCGTPFVFYTEPDKKEFFKNGLSELLNKITSEENLGICLASRSEKAFASFPSFQQMTETTINNCCTELIKQPLDYTYGPFMLNRNLIPHLNMVKEDIGWGWRPYLFNITHRLGYTIDLFAGDFFCPQEQREDDLSERIYRMKQLEQNIRAIVLSASADINNFTQHL